jgi:hypothetical protein
MTLRSERLLAERPQGAADADPDIQWIAPEMSIEATDLPPATDGVNTESRNNFLWNLRQVHAAKSAAAGVQARVVAVLDSGINTGHVDLKDNRRVRLHRAGRHHQQAEQGGRQRAARAAAGHGARRGGGAAQ